jgi:hypothetical protein
VSPITSTYSPSTLGSRVWTLFSHYCLDIDVNESYNRVAE